jgi:hypothetical protein
MRKQCAILLRDHFNHLCIHSMSNIVLILCAAYVDRVRAQSSVEFKLSCKAAMDYAQ